MPSPWEPRCRTQGKPDHTRGAVSAGQGRVHLREHVGGPGGAALRPRQGESALDGLTLCENRTVRPGECPSPAQRRWDSWPTAK